jgi:glycosyltransferase involved in cell wall biosynthesis
LKILFYTISSRDAVGGAEGVRSTLEREFRDRGHVVTTVYTESEADLSETVEGRWTLPVTGVQTRWKVPTLSSVLQATGSLARLARCLHTVRPDIVNVHYVDVRSAYFVALRPFFGYRLVLTAHGSDVLQPFSRVNLKALPYLLRRADAIVAVSEAVAEGARTAAPTAASRISVVENGVDLTFWSPALDGPYTGPPRIVHVGRLSHVKGQDLLLTAFVQVLHDHPAAHLELVGGGGEREALEAMARSLGIAESVSFLGALSPEAVRQRLWEATVAVLPSRSEGLPLSLLEAFGTGVPVVATSVGGVPAAAGDPPACLLVPPESPGALAEAIGQVLSKSDLRARLREQELLRSQVFSLDRQVNRTETLMERLLVNGPGRGQSPSVSGAVLR